MPWRAASVIKGKVWNDSNQNGLIDDNESGLGSVSLFLDDNGNFKLDDNETSFKPSEDGKFIQVVPPGRHSLCIQPDSPEARVTWPEDEHKRYLTWVNFEHSSETLYLECLIISQVKALPLTSQIQKMGKMRKVLKTLNRIN